MTNTDKKRLDELCAGKSAEWFETRAEYLGGFITEQRLLTMTRTLDMRTRYMTVCMENTFHPQNASALVRTCEAFGIQDIYTIDNLCRFNPNLHIVKGTDKWIDIRRSGSTDAALDTLQSAGYRIIATTPHRRYRSPATHCFRCRPQPGCPPCGFVPAALRQGLYSRHACTSDSDCSASEPA